MLNSHLDSMTVDECRKRFSESSKDDRIPIPVAQASVAKTRAALNDGLLPCTCSIRPCGGMRVDGRHSKLITPRNVQASTL